MNLTPRERQVAKLVAEGLTNKSIGQCLYIGERTVQSHLSSIFRKLGLTRRAELVAWVLKPELCCVRKQKKLTSSQIKILSVVVSLNGATTKELAKLLRLKHQTMCSALLKLLQNQIIFKGRITKNRIQWFPTITGLTIYKANKQFKEGMLKNYVKRDEEKIETQK